jgi:hypothetical protein
MNSGDRLIPPHGGYRRLKSFQVAQLVYDVTVRFCANYVSRLSFVNLEIRKSGSRA